MKRGSFFIWLAVLLGSLWTAGCSAAESPGSLGDNEARVLLQHHWNQPDTGLLLGDVKFVSQDTNMSQGRESIREWPLYEAFARAGVIVLQNVKDTTTGDFNWKDYSESLSGVVKTATVTATEHGKATGTITHLGEFDKLGVKVITIRIESIAANDEVSVGTDKYHVVVGTHTVDVPVDMLAAYQAARGQDVAGEHRFKVLLKFDPVDKNWVETGVGDFAKRTDDFRTNNVTKTLQAMKAGLQ